MAEAVAEAADTAVLALVGHLPPLEVVAGLAMGGVLLPPRTAAVVLLAVPAVPVADTADLPEAPPATAVSVAPPGAPFPVSTTASPQDQEQEEAAPRPAAPLCVASHQTCRNRFPPRQCCM